MAVVVSLYILSLLPVVIYQRISWITGSPLWSPPSQTGCVHHLSYLWHRYVLCASWVSTISCGVCGYWCYPESMCAQVYTCWVKPTSFFAMKIRSFGINCIIVSFYIFKCWAKTQDLADICFPTIKAKYVELLILMNIPNLIPISLANIGWETLFKKCPWFSFYCLIQ